MRENSAARFALHWSGTVTMETQRDGRELVLRFSRPLGDVALDRVPERLESWVDNILYGYDSVVLVLGAGVEAAVATDPAGLSVALTRSPAAAPTREAQAADRAAQRRLDYFRALALMEGGDLRPARTLLRDLLEQDPKDAQSTALLAQAEERLGRWRDAIMAYDTALELTPDEPSLVRGKALLLHETADRSRLDLDWQKVRSADMQRIARFRGVQELGRSTSLTWALERREVDVDSARREDGRLEPFHVPARGWRRRWSMTGRSWSAPPCPSMPPRGRSVPATAISGAATNPKPAPVSPGASRASPSWRGSSMAAGATACSSSTRTGCPTAGRCRSAPATTAMGCPARPIWRAAPRWRDRCATR
ncbi:tetratricopeptide repeat protein [Azospirillum sp. A26]|uniref:tetratricopeptide repeat protein n=1 Tax=Azospirillum sp. A26 TaxID=3160607 RepID=UPI00366FAEB6